MITYIYVYVFKYAYVCMYVSYMLPGDSNVGLVQEANSGAHTVERTINSYFFPILSRPK